MKYTRRTILRGAGVALSLPLFESFATAQQAKRPIRRLVAINVSLGLHAQYFTPSQAGSGYQLTPYLNTIGALRDQFTVISGTTHPELSGGHSASHSYLSAAPHPGSAGFRNSISIDQYVARQFGQQTRYSYLALGDEGETCSVSSNGVPIPGQRSPSRIFAKLFLEARPAQKAQQIERIKEGQSILDVVLGKANRLRTRISRRDQQKLDEYLTAVRETEQRLTKAEQWEQKPKPIVNARRPEDVRNPNDVFAKARLMYDVMRLAIQTDSTRVISYTTAGPSTVPVVQGVSVGYHNLSHHGKDPEKLKQLALVEQQHMQALGVFLKQLHETREDDATLLDRTIVFFVSHMGNASSHNNKNLPVLLAGGGFKHGQHLAFDQNNNYPLPNLFVSMLQRLGFETDKFASSTGTMQGLEFAG